MKFMEDKPRSSIGTLRWFVQAGLGILLVILLGVHLIVNHLVAPQGLLSYADVIRYYDVPGIALMEVLFLIVVTAHCLLGVHSILLDLNLPSSFTKTLIWVLVVLGVAGIVYGIRLTWVIAVMPVA